tara:strand:+ start:425 stop:604 length:180 start_codon:yes stop_codon:yes gene_type:complete
MENNTKNPDRSIVSLKSEDISALKEVQTVFQERVGVKLTYSQMVRMLTKFWLENSTNGG